MSTTDGRPIKIVSIVDEHGEALVTRRYAAPACDDPALLVAKMSADVRAALRREPNLTVGTVQDGAPEMWTLTRDGLSSLRQQGVLGRWEEGGPVRDSTPQVKLINLSGRQMQMHLHDTAWSRRGRSCTSISTMSIDETGRLTLGRICVQRTDAHRAWLGSELALPGEVNETHTRTLYDTAARVAEALTHAGYFGPFGLDGYLWRTPQGALAFNPLGELNARYTMGFAVGFGSREV